MRKMDLSGIWKLKLDVEKKGIENEYFKNAFIFEDEITLPGTVSQQKKSPETDERALGYLTDPYKFEGWMWAKLQVNKDVLKDFTHDSNSNSYRIILERTRVTRLWINETEIESINATANSLNGMHIYNFNLTENELQNDLQITILVSNVDYIVPGGHMTSADTQTNWLGITGEMSLINLNEERIENLKISTDFSIESKINIECDYTGNCNKDCEIKIHDLLCEIKNLKPGKNFIQLILPKETEFWSDTNPKLYELQLSLVDGEKFSVKTGFRSFIANGKFFECNGKKVFLRGKHDGLIFPKTGFAPTDKESWLKVLKTAKNYGINHYRFHTCCPPKAAFEAADELGIYMSPELPFWGTIQAPGEEGFNKEQQEYLISEGYKILDNFANHPSFVMMSMGNELWGSEKRLDDIMKNYHQYDSSRLYTGGSNNFQFWPRTTEHEDYFVGVRFAQNSLIRGSYAQCDAPLGFIQTDEPNTNHNYDEFFGVSDSIMDSDGSEKEIEIQFGTGVKKVKAGGETNQFIPNKPCISHEVGQYCMYPNFEENKLYTGVLKPYNFEIFKERLAANGMENRAGDFFRDSSRLAVQCYKNEIEAALRSNELSGFQLLDIQDFTGQGTAVVGVLNSFMESKGIVSGSQWRSFCNETVLLASFEKYVWQNKEKFSAEIILHNYSDNNFANQFVTAYLIDAASDEIICEEQFDISVTKRGNLKLGLFKYDFDKVEEYKKYVLLLTLNSETGDENEETEILNSYILHVYPSVNEKVSNELLKLENQQTIELFDVTLTTSKEIAKEAAGKNKKVIYFPVDFSDKQTVPGTYCTDFWCYPMFRSISESMNKQVPVGTLGLTIQTDDLLLKDFPTDSYTTPKWYNIINHSTCVNLCDSKIQPIVQMIDNFERNWKLGILWEEDGLIVCTSRLWEIATKPEVCAFILSLINN